MRPWIRWTSHGRRHAVVLECNLPVGVVFKRASEMNEIRLTVRATVRIVDLSCTLKKQVDFVRRYNTLSDRAFEISSMLLELHNVV